MKNIPLGLPLLLSQRNSDPLFTTNLAAQNPRILAVPHCASKVPVYTDFISLISVNSPCNFLSPLLPP